MSTERRIGLDTATAGLGAQSRQADAGGHAPRREADPGVREEFLARMARGKDVRAESRQPDAAEPGGLPTPARARLRTGSPSGNEDGAAEARGRGPAESGEGSGLPAGEFGAGFAGQDKPRTDAEARRGMGLAPFGEPLSGIPESLALPRLAADEFRIQSAAARAEESPVGEVDRLPDGRLRDPGVRPDSVGARASQAQVQAQGERRERRPGGDARNALAVGPVPPGMPAGALAPAGAASPPGPTSRITPWIGSVARLLVQDSLGGRRAVTVELKDKPLEKVAVSTFEEGGRLVVEFRCPTEAPVPVLEKHGAALAGELAGRLRRPVTLCVLCDGSSAGPEERARYLAAPAPA